MSRVAGIIQARMGSSRLPGKMLMPAGGTTVLGYLVARVKLAKSLDAIIVATSTAPENDAIEEECRELGTACFRADGEEDVLKRYLMATRWLKADAAVRITGDSVLIDPLVIDYVVKQYLSGGCDCATNYPTGTFPTGSSLSVFSAASLETLNDLELDADEREHVILAYLRYRDRFKIREIEAPPEWRAYPLSLALDTEEDYARISEIIKGLHKPGKSFGLEDILSFLRQQNRLNSPNRSSGE